MEEFRLWLVEGIAQKRLAHTALFEVSTTYIEMIKLNELEDEIVDLRTALTKYLEFQRVLGAHSPDGHVDDHQLLGAAAGGFPKVSG